MESIKTKITMKKLLFLLFTVISITAFGQAGSLSQSVYRSRVNDSTTVTTPAGYGLLYYNNQRATPAWIFSNDQGATWYELGSGTGSGSGTTMNNLPVEYKVTNYSLVPGDTSRLIVLKDDATTLTLGDFSTGVDGSQFVIYNETGATVTIDPSTYITKGPLEILDTTYAYIHFNADTFRISTATTGGGGGSGTVTSVAVAAGTTGTDVNVSGSPITTSGTITLNIPTSSGTNRGALSSADWTTFNNKQSAITFGTGVQTALGVNIGSAGAPVLFNGAGGTPSSLIGTNITGTATGLTSGITNALKSATTTVDVSAATAPTSGQVLTATSATAATWQTPSAGGSSYWTTVPGTPTRTGNYTFTVTDAANANLYNRLLTRTTVLKWTDSGNTKMAMVVSATYAADVVTVTIMGDILNVGFTSMRYALEKADRLTFAIAGSLTTGTNLSRKHKAFTELKVFGADALHGTAGSTNATTYDINKNGTTIFTTKISVSSGLTVGNGFTADDGTTITLDDVLTLDCDSVSTAVPVDAYIDLFVFPLYSQYLN